MKRKWNWKYILWISTALFALTAGVIFTISISANAISAVRDASSIDAFAKLEGDAGYIIYADNYYLDMEETDWLESGPWILNNIANMLFTFVKWLGKTTVTLYYYCMTFDLAELFSDEIKSIQEALKDGIFTPMFTLGFAATAIVILKKMYRRDLIGAYGQIAKVVGITMLSILVVSESSTVLSSANGVTRELSTAAIVGMQGEEVSSTSSFAAQSAGVLWVNLIHQPWVYIEFGNDDIHDLDIINELLTKAPTNETRLDIVKTYTRGDAFSMERAGEKIGFMFLYMIPMAVKCVIYIAMAIFSMIFQLIAIFYVFLAPVVLILSMFPGYENLMSSWLRKFLESQVSILVMSFIIGLLVNVDELLFSVFAKEWGWLVVMIVQVILGIAIIIKRDTLLGALSKVQKGASNPGYANSMMETGVDGVAVTKGLAHGAVTAGKASVKGAAIAGRASVNGMKAAGHGIYNYGHTVGALRNNKQTSLMAASNSVSMDKYGNIEPVKRPRMDEKAKTSNAQEEKIISYASRAKKYHASSGSSTSSEPQIEVKRPRMDNSGIQNQNAQNKALNERKKANVQSSGGKPTQEKKETFKTPGGRTSYKSESVATRARKQSKDSGQKTVTATRPKSSVPTKSVVETEGSAAKVKQG